MGIELGFPDLPYQRRFIGEHAVRRRCERLQQLRQGLGPAACRCLFAIRIGADLRQQRQGQLIGQGQERLRQRQQVGIAAGGKHFLEPAVFAQLRIELHEPLALGGLHALTRRLHRQQAGERIDARGDVGPAQFARQGRLEILRVGKRRHHQLHAREIQHAVLLRLQRLTQRLVLAQQRAHGLLPEIGSGRDRYGGKQHAFSGFSEGW